eukprot:1172000-Amphidinium_carterae.1
MTGTVPETAAKQRKKEHCPNRSDNLPAFAGNSPAMWGILLTNQSVQSTGKRRATRVAILAYYHCYDDDYNNYYCQFFGIMT